MARRDRRKSTESRPLRLANNRLSLDEIEEAKKLDGPTLPLPKTRGECVDGLRPCPFVRCKWHLGADVIPTSGALIVTFPQLDVTEIPKTCALDVADAGAATLEQTGQMLNLTRERVRQIETIALAKLFDQARGAGFEPHEFRPGGAAAPTTATAWGASAPLRKLLPTGACWRQSNRRSRARKAGIPPDQLDLSRPQRLRRDQLPSDVNEALRGGVKSHPFDDPFDDPFGPVSAAGTPPHARVRHVSARPMPGAPLHTEGPPTRAQFPAQFPAQNRQKIEITEQQLDIDRPIVAPEQSAPKNTPHRSAPAATQHESLPPRVDQPAVSAAPTGEHTMPNPSKHLSATGKAADILRAAITATSEPVIDDVILDLMDAGYDVGSSYNFGKWIKSAREGRAAGLDHFLESGPPKRSTSAKRSKKRSTPKTSTAMALVGVGNNGVNASGSEKGDTQDPVFVNYGFLVRLDGSIWTPSADDAIALARKLISDGGDA